MTSSELASLLFTRGWIVVRSYEDIRRADIEAAVMGFPEFADHPSFSEVDSTRRYVCGSTSFCGSPSFFHHEVFRKQSDMTFLKHYEIFMEYARLLEIDDVQIKIARWLDRTMIRPPGVSPAGESWHQDSPALERNGEMWTGGWTNFDNDDQHFAAVSGTHVNGSKEGIGGFKAIEKSQHAHFEACLKEQAGMAGYNKRGYIIVPPGHTIIFNSSLVHKVNPTKKKTTSVKTFFDVRYTPFNDSGIFPTKPPDDNIRVPVSFGVIEDAMLANASMYLPSGQMSVMYPANYLVCKEKQLHLYEAFERDRLVPGAMKRLRDDDGNIEHKSHKYHDHTRSMRSLQEQGLPLHTPFHPVEFERCVPSFEPNVLNWETGEVFKCKRARIE